MLDKSSLTASTGKPFVRSGNPFFFVVLHALLSIDFIWLSIELLSRVPSFFIESVLTLAAIWFGLNLVELTLPLQDTSRPGARSMNWLSLLVPDVRPWRRRDAKLWQRTSHRDRGRVAKATPLCPPLLLVMQLKPFALLLETTKG